MGIFERRIEAGAALLDTKRPGWEREITLDTLDLSDGECCVLGQLYGTFTEGTYTLGLPWWEANDPRGFSVGPEIYYPELTEAWKDAIRARRARRARASGGE